MEVLIPLAVVGGTLLLRYAHVCHMADVWRRVARGVGLTDVRETGLLGSLKTLEGDAGPFRVRIGRRSQRRSERGARIVVDSRGAIPPSLDFRAEGLATAFDRATGGKELVIGDPAFDNAVYVRGAEEPLFAALDAPTRAAVRAFVALPGRVSDGLVSVEVKDVFPDAATLSAVLASAMDLAQRLSRPDDMVARLVTNARHDPEREVRRLNLGVLADRYSDHPVVREALRETMRTSDRELRLRAALALGAEGRATLLELAEDPNTPEDIVVPAVRGLGRDIKVEWALAFLETSLGRQRIQAALGVVWALARLREPAALARLAELAAAPDRALALASVRALAGYENSVAEPALIEALRHDDADLRLAAASALGRFGTTAAVVPLHAAVSAHPLDLDLRATARQAIAAIQSRVPGASPGQISLASGESGLLSLANGDEHGAVTLAENAGDTGSDGVRLNDVGPDGVGSDSDAQRPARQCKT